MDRAKCEEELRALLANLEIIEMSVAPLARVYYLRYDALIKAGFKPDHALMIIVQRGLE